MKEEPGVVKKKADFHIKIKEASVKQSSKPVPSVINTPKHTFYRG